MISSGANFCNCGRIRFSNAARNLALPSSGASGALTMVSCSPRSPLAPVPEFPDIMLVVTERDRIQAAFRRLAAHQFAETLFRKHLADRAQPVGPFRMAGRRGMVET